MNEFDNGLDKKWSFDFDVPSESEVEVSKLDSVLNDGDTLIFYGGEPLVNFSKMKEIMDYFDNESSNSNKKINFCMQTNGKLLGSVDFNYINRLSKMLVSIDGDKERTDYNRGKGTYDLVIKNIKDLREKGYKGEIVARMTLSYNFSDLFEQVKHIINLIENGIFDSVHWQIDAGFYRNDFDEKHFGEFVKNYNKSLDLLIEYWIRYMKENNKVLKLYPLIGILNRLMGWDKETRLMCGSGYANYTITTDGKITTCPITNNIKDFYCGDINNKGEKLKEFYVGEPCTSCEYLNICGGRCLYSNKAKLWPVEGEKLVCKTIIHLIESLKERIPGINELIEKGIVKEEDFQYEKFFGPEIIP